MAEIKIEHSRAQGTLAVASGGRYGDGVYELMHKAGFRYSNTYNLGAYYIRSSRGKAPNRAKIALAERLLTQFEHRVTVVIDDDGAGPVPADALAASPSVRRAAGSGPAGRRAPLAPGGRAKPAGPRPAARVLPVVPEAGAAGHGTVAAANWQMHRDELPKVVERIAALEADGRRLAREMAASHGTEELAACAARISEVHRELAHWCAIRTEAEANGLKVYGPEDFAAGDYALIGNAAYEVLKVNRKSLRVPQFTPGGGTVCGLPIVTRDTTSAQAWTDTRPYAMVSGRLSADELAALADDP